VTEIGNAAVQLRLATEYFGCGCDRSVLRAHVQEGVAWLIEKLKRGK
jgi:hypothetical protein